MAGKQAKKQGQPLSGIALIPYYIYSSGKEPQPYLLNFVNQKPTARICQTEKTGKSDFT